MSKPVMGAPRSRADVLANLQRADEAISEAPATPPANPVPETAQAPTSTEVVTIEPPRAGNLDLTAIRALKIRKEPTLQTNARLPISLLDDIDLIRSLTGINATDIITAGTRMEVARLKKQYGLE